MLPKWGEGSPVALAQMAQVLSPANGNPAVAMLAALFLAALIWNVGTWALAIPNSSSHALIGSLIGISISAALKFDGSLHQRVDWGQIWKVLEALLISPLIGFIGAAAELVSAVVIGIAGFTGGPVSTTHVVTSGITGTMVSSGAGVHMGTIWRIMLAWVLTLPATILISGALFYLFS